MRLARIYQQQPLNSGKIIHLSKEAAHHLVRVLRLDVGAEFILFNGEGGEFKAHITSVQKNSVSAQIGIFNPVDNESSLQIILAQTIVKPEKMDYVLQKSVELGVTHIVPLITERCLLPKLSPERWEKRLAHWQAILINACEQSGRTKIPTVSRAVAFKTALQQIKADIRVILAPNATQTFSQLYSQQWDFQQGAAKESNRSVYTIHEDCELSGNTAENLSAKSMVKSCYCAAVLVGPEGGWSESEMKSALAADYLPIQLGPRILRTETAGLVALTLLQAAYGDISLNLV
ncbi:ribosomal RNA small subunit methyltransferase E [Candidatus Rickettsiella viridis]|uniref:Ribosomal RNA small subunit methyltransferase E n=1 Tax=Candidatus Rickettsiella viridis TaxID=676208 RepID=A0A2Z5UVV8_9COXI|nr:16S rRNA (uracil(1498)-N(3))-methyltransferase [Candidatus Rickettsiella viridis]BBB15195.1 ribosomal RNA small subunit methyltransferase E [Candidatus Rickettsiella viridis]